MFSWTDKKNNLTLPLKQFPCLYCTTLVQIGHPLCVHHNLQYLKIKIQPSSLKNVGLGLWTVKCIKKGALIAPYVAEQLTAAQFRARYPTKNTCPYVVQCNNIYWDASALRGIASLANTFFNTRGQSVQRQCNAVLDTTDPTDRVPLPTFQDHIWLRAPRDIPAQTEIFAYYGSEFRLDNICSTNFLFLNTLAQQH